MTGYTVHTGSTEKFTEGWDQIFKSRKKPAPKKPAATKKKPAKAARKKK